MKKNFSKTILITLVLLFGANEMTAAEQPSLAQLDSLLLRASFPQAREAIARVGVSDRIKARYLKFCEELVLLRDLNLHETVQICEAGLLYHDQFTESSHGPEALKYYAAFVTLFDAKQFRQAALNYKMAQFKKVLFIMILRERIEKKLAAAEVLFQEANYDQAVSLMLDIEDDIYKYPIFSQYIKDYDLKLRIYQDMRLVAGKGNPLLDKTYVIRHATELSLLLRPRGLESKYDELKPVVNTHTRLTWDEVRPNLDKYTVKTEPYLGVAYSGRISTKNTVNLRLLSSQSTYSAGPDSIGEDPGFTVRDWIFSAGLKLNWNDHGRLVYYSAIYLNRIHTEVTTNEPGRNPFIRTGQLDSFTPPRFYSTEIELQVGASYYFVSMPKLVLRPSLIYVQNGRTDSDFARQYLTMSLSVGYCL